MSWDVIIENLPLYFSGAWVTLQLLAISLLFGLASSTLLTVLVIPAIYIALRYRPADKEKNVPA